MRHASRHVRMQSGTELLIPTHERIIDRLYFFAFAAMLVLMSIGYLCLCGFLLWVFF